MTPPKRPRGRPARKAPKPTPAGPDPTPEGPAQAAQAAQAPETEVIQAAEPGASLAADLAGALDRMPPFPKAPEPVSLKHPTLADIPPALLRGVPPRHQRLAQRVYSGQTFAAAMRAEGYAGKNKPTNGALALRDAAMDKIQAIVDALLVEFSVRAGRNKDWCTANLVNLVRSASQAQQVFDSKGKPTGIYRLDVAGARGCLELLGKDMGMFKSGESALKVSEVAQLLAAVADRGRPPLPGDRARVINPTPDDATR